ncbi:MAG: hypothetical protein E6J41_09885 [Chloroflexi bacterium]|nr:MAG: hypothetical protein E6J41_09885 [Chloroflexota bacterium]
MAADVNAEVVRSRNDCGRGRLPGLPGLLGIEVLEARPLPRSDTRHEMERHLADHDVQLDPPDAAAGRPGSGLEG